MSDALTRAARAAYLANVNTITKLNDASWAAYDANKKAELTKMAAAAILSFLDGEDVVEACARAMTHEHWAGESAEFRATRLEVNTEKAQRAIAALRALVQEEK